jgi:hypothetical protein
LKTRRTGFAQLFGSGNSCLLPAVKEEEEGADGKPERRRQSPDDSMRGKYFALPRVTS